MMTDRRPFLVVGGSLSVPVMAGSNSFDAINARITSALRQGVNRQQIYIIGTHAEDLAQLAQLRNLRRAPPALPKVDRLRLDPDHHRQLELCPAALLP